MGVWPHKFMQHILLLSYSENNDIEGLVQE